MSFALSKICGKISADLYELFYLLRNYTYQFNGGSWISNLL